MPKAKPRDPNQRAKATIDEVIARTERNEPPHGVRVERGGEYLDAVWLSWDRRPPILITSEEEATRNTEP